MQNAINEIQASLRKVGYSESMVSSNVSFIQEGGNCFRTDMVAYSSSLRKDVDTAVIAVKNISDVNNVDFDCIKPFYSIATPIVIFAEFPELSNKSKTNFRTLGLSKNKRSFNQQLKKSKIIPFSKFEQYLLEKKELFTPRRLEAAKCNHEQLLLFDLFPDLLGKAFEIASNELIDKFEKAVSSIILDTASKQKRIKVVEASIKFLGARLLRDRINQKWPLSDINSFFKEAINFLPNYFKVNRELRNLISPLLSKLHDGYDLSQVSLDMVGQLYENFYVDENVRREAGVHYTRSRLAKTIVKRIPIEELHPDRRILWDPTCGSGNLLAAGYERLATAEYLKVPTEERHQKLVKMIYGNDKDDIAAMIARMTLMLFHPPHKNNWNITKFDAESKSFSADVIKRIGNKPNIIIANPPFGGIGLSKSTKDVPRPKGQRDRSAYLLNKCLEILAEDGLMGIILTESFLDQIQERDIRKRVANECQILEQWSIPSRWFEGVQRSAQAIILRKTPPNSNFYYLYSISNVPEGNDPCEVKNLKQIDINSSNIDLIATKYDAIFNKMANGKKQVSDFFKVFNGFRKPKNLLTKNLRSKTFQLFESKTDASLPIPNDSDYYNYSGNAIGTTPYTDLRNERNLWIFLPKNHKVITDNFNTKNQRYTLRKQILKRTPSVLLRANRTDPQREKWSSVSLIDLPLNNQRSVAPYSCFHVSFPKSGNKEEQEIFSYALWAIFNHPLSSLYFYEKKRVQSINVPQIKNFPLPKNWDKDELVELAKISSQLIDIVRTSPLQIDYETANQLIHKMDNTIYKLYGINNQEIMQIDRMFAGYNRPIFKGISVGKQSANNRKKMECKIAIQYSGRIRTTTFETLEINSQKNLVKVAIDGMDDDAEIPGISSSGIWIKLISVMPGWLLKEGATGWIELTTGNARLISKSPEEYILGFKMFKNAYMSEYELSNQYFSDKAL